MRRRVLIVCLCLVTTLLVAQSRGGPFSISGTVVNAVTGEPLGGARLELAPTEGARWVKAALTQKDGRFTFGNLAAGKYQLFGERSGFARQGFDEHTGFLSAIVTGSSADSEHLVFRLQPGATITGTVNDEYNEAVRGAEVMLFQHTLNNGRLGTYLVAQDQTDDRGLYRFGPLMTGTYYVVISARPWYAQNMMRFERRFGSYGASADQETSELLNVAYPLTFYSDATEESEASPIKLRTGDTFRADFTLRGVQAASLRISSAGTQNAQAQSVELTQKLFDDEERPVPSIQDMASREGRVITGFPPGHYLVHVQQAGQRESLRSQWMDLYGETTLDPDSITGAATASIDGIASAEGVKLKNAFIQLRNRETGQAQGSRIGADGKFTIPQIAAGTYEISVANTDSVYLANMAASNAKASGRTLEIPPGADVRMAVILSKGIGQIACTAVKDGKGRSGVLVLLVPDDPFNHLALFRRDQSDSDGTFSLKQVVPGRYTLLAIENGWELEWNDPKTLKPFLEKGSRMQVEPNGNYDIKVAVQQAK